MQQTSMNITQRAWYDSAQASLCLLGACLCRMGFFAPLERQVHIRQKILKYTPTQKLEMLFVGLLTGSKAVCHTTTAVRIDPTLMSAFGLLGCAEQSVLADTLDAPTEADVAALQEALTEIFRRYSQARQHDFTQGILVLDVDMSLLPASKRAEGSERGYMGRFRSKTGCKLVWESAATSQETVWETVGTGHTAESLAALKDAIVEAEQLLGLAWEDEEVLGKRVRTELRLDGGWGGQEMITWLLTRGYRITGKFKSNSRVRKLVRGITNWQPTHQPRTRGRCCSWAVRPLTQYAARTPSKEQESGYYHAVLWTRRIDLTVTQVVEH